MKKIVVSILFLAGVIIMSYPFVSTYINKQNSLRTISKYNQVIEQNSNQEKKRLFSQAKEYNKRLLEGIVTMSDPFDTTNEVKKYEDYYSTFNVQDDGMMGYINIDKIDVHLPIYHGTTSDVLKRAVGHLQGTSLPVGGKGTHTVLSAHNGLSDAKLFTDLDKLKKGDTFQIKVLGKTMTYQVYSKEVVEPAEISSLYVDKDQDLCTLLTCTPYGINTHRLLVHAKRIKNLSEKKKVKEEKNYFIYTIGIILVSFLFIILLIVSIKKRIKRGKLKK